MVADLTVRPLATFRGLRHVPLLALSHNSLFPSLAIGADGVILRIVRRHHLRFEDIEAVDLSWRLAHQVTFVPQQGPWTFSANFLDRGMVLRVLAALDSGNAPLTLLAQSFLRAGPQPGVER